MSQSLMRSAGDDRNVMDLFTLSNVFEYGCWCHFGDSPLPRGPSQDTVDGFCNRWWNTRDCIKIDANNNNKVCDVSMQLKMLSPVFQTHLKTKSIMKLCATTPKSVNIQMLIPKNALLKTALTMPTSFELFHPYGFQPLELI